MRIVTECVISSAHQLPCYEGKCKNLHGHNWRVKVCIDGWPLETGPYQGMIIDFSVIKEIVNRLDHTYLNEVIENPTAETIAIWVCKELMKVTDNNGNVDSVIIQVYETEKSYAQISSAELSKRMREETVVLGATPPYAVDESNKDVGSQIVDEESEDDGVGEEDTDSG